MQLRQLEYVTALARERHFGRAAAACHVSQPSLSGGIRALEEELGVPIVVRGRRYAGLTPEGERVVAWAHRLLADAEGLREDLAAMRGEVTGRLRLGAIPTALPIASQLSAAVAAVHPGLAVTVLSLTSREIERRLGEYEIDAGITYLDNEPIGGVRAIPVARERYVLYVNADDPLAKRRSVTWAEAAALPLCLLTPNMQNRRIIDAAFTTAGASPAPRVESDDIVPLWEHVAHGRWCTIGPTSWIEGGALPDEIVAVPLTEPEVEKEIGVVVPDRDPLPTITRALVDVARGPG
ncbi:MAG: LysR family transcriptional regulator [Actinobacteria bacterium]|nr:LysR family transcriptional regulator [Actinomycetota bacterium]